MRVVLAGGTTETARIDGISATGADSTLLAHTPSAVRERAVALTDDRLADEPEGAATPGAARRES